MHMEIARNSVLIAICRQSGDNWQSKNRATNGNRKIGRQMAIENPVSNYFDLRSSIVLMFSIAAYPV